MSRLRSHWLDAAIVIAACASTLEGLLRGHAAALAIGADVLLLLGRRRLPFAAPAALWLGAAGVSFADGEIVTLSLTTALAGGVAAVLLGNLRDETEARLGLAIIVVAAAIVAANDPSGSSADLLAVPAEFVIAWILGYALRERAVRAEAAEAASRVAVAEERARIARELHDVVAHAVSVMVLQVGAVRHRLPPERADDVEALQRVELAGRTALTEMRGLLGAMRREGDAAELGPQPGLADLDALLGGIRRAGLPVELHVEGTPAPLPAGVDLSAYRIIQEGLTNALKHAHAHHADVRLRYDPEVIEIEVRDDGRAGVPIVNGTGHGLVGIRERVKLYGGEVRAGRANGGGFVLHTTLPLVR